MILSDIIRDVRGIFRKKYPVRTLIRKIVRGAEI